MAFDPSATSLAGTGAAYQEHPAPAALRGAFGQLWQSQLDADASGSITVLPDGCVDILWRNGVLFAVGPDRVAAHPQLAPGAQVLGARFQPGQAQAALGISLADMLGQAIPLAELKGRWAKDVADAVGDAPPHRRMQRLATLLHPHMGQPTDDLAARRAKALFHGLAEGSSIDALAEHLDLHPRSLRRLSQQQFGYGAKTLQRILRLQRFLRGCRSDATLAMAARAADAGYADQAHLSRDARELAGMTATALWLQWTR
ncbi:DUF6597 domain-containing transcriptional factor [Stenotrophomonas sp. S41]|uniref:DUF6597 domain-containing transcriptional factor n=1 Tax=Stenotrophomonas sp. S41 TaxID=2767464 RepID=UPI00190D6A8B|nr:DUF6597 domain-containing transcriptional factor [Stenotrophomonas sp. S41]MBK0012979.1 helix-turn-helix transcriptional regulator [Stenotrophomonas sp. S41]